MTLYVFVLLVGGWCAVVAGLALVAHVIRSARSRPARRPDRRIQASGGVVLAASRVYQSRAAGAQSARDRVVALPVEEAGATTYLARPALAVLYPRAGSHTSARAGRHRMAGAVR